MKKIKTILMIIITLILIGKAVALEYPALPMVLHGEATLNSQDAPIGSKIIAKIEGETRGSIQITESGKYGKEEGDIKLGVTGTKSTQGKQIEFFLKVSGYEELKSDDAQEWISGEDIKFDISFNGELVKETMPAEETDPDTATATPSGSVAGGAEGAVVSDGNDKLSLYYFDRIFANNQVDMILNIAGMPLTRLQLILKNDVDDVDFTFDMISNPEKPALEAVYNYLSINVSKDIDSMVEIAIIRFKVPNDWFDKGYDPEKVVMMRYSEDEGMWQELTTIHEGGDEMDHYYRAQTPGFSYFAIKSEKIYSEQDNVKNNIEAEEKEINDEEGNMLTGNIVDDSSLKGNPIIALLVLVSLVIAGILYKKKNMGE